MTGRCWERKTKISSRFTPPPALCTPWRRRDAKKHKEQIQKNADWLLETAIGLKGGKLEGWSYPGNQIADGSNTHYAVMGLHAATQAGAKVDAKLWEQIRDMYFRTQRNDGA